MQSLCYARHVLNIVCFVSSQVCAEVLVILVGHDLPPAEVVILAQASAPWEGVAHHGFRMRRLEKMEYQGYECHHQVLRTFDGQDSLRASRVEWDESVVHPL